MAKCVHTHSENFSGITVNKHRTGNGHNTIFNGHRCFPIASIVNLGPGHVVIAHELQKLRALSWRIQADTDNFKSIGMVLLIGGDYVGKFMTAGAAPGCPKIQEHNFALVVLGEIDFWSVYRRKVKERGFLAGEDGCPNIV